MLKIKYIWFLYNLRSFSLISSLWGGSRLLLNLSWWEFFSPEVGNLKSENFFHFVRYMAKGASNALGSSSYFILKILFSSWILEDDRPQLSDYGIFKKYFDSRLWIFIESCLVDLDLFLAQGSVESGVFIFVSKGWIQQNTSNVYFFIRNIGEPKTS